MNELNKLAQQKIAERQISKVYRWQNDLVMVFDQHGQQMCEYQGTYGEVREKILTDATEQTQFFGADWHSPAPLDSF